MRSQSSAITTALTSFNCPMLVLVEMNFDSGTIRCCNAAYSFNWNGYEWFGVGQLGSISSVQEGHELQMYGCTLTLSGLDPAIVSLALTTEEFQGRVATIWLAPLSDSYALLADPIVIFEGRMDIMPIRLGKTADISLNIESKLIDWERARVRRYNNEDQQSEYPSDLSMQYVEQMTEKELIWGRA